MNQLQASVYITDESQLEKLQSPDQCEIILSCQQISAAASSTLDKMNALIMRAQQAKIEKICIEWDSLMTTPQLRDQWEVIISLPWQHLYALRVRDQGALELASTHDQIRRVHFLAEAGHRNFRGLEVYLHRYAPKLTRLVFSPEIPQLQLQHWSQHLSCEKEILGFGKILLFSSPRPLLEFQAKAQFSELLNQAGQDIWQAQGNSEESPHRGFFFFQGPKGLLMFLPKELSLLPYLSEIKQAGITHIRLDWRFEARDVFAEKIISLFKNYTEDSYLAFKQHYPAPLIPGFFLANQTDRQFKNLKNTRLSRSGDNFFGEVKDVRKGEYVVIQVGPHSQKLPLCAEFEFIHPEGKKGFWKISEWANLEGEKITEARAGQLIVVPYRTQLSTRTQLFLNPSN